MRGTAKLLARALRHPVMVTVVGLGIFVTGLFELLEEHDPTFDHWLGVHHGIMLVGFFTALKEIVESVEGLQTASERLGEADP